MFPSDCRRYFLAVMLLILVPSCSTPPTNSDGGDLTRLEVEYISRNLALSTELKFPILKHKLISRYIDSLGQQLVSRNKSMPPLPYEFRVLKTNDVNFFSLPGGVVYITLGAIRALNTEAELAAAISHELAHQQLSHPLNLWRTRVNANRDRAFALTKSGDWNARFLGPVGYLNYGNGAEIEADQILPLIMYNGGFDQRAALILINRLQELNKSNFSQIAALNSFHPEFEERKKTIQAAILKLPPQREGKFSSSSFLEIKALLKEAEKKRKK